MTMCHCPAWSPGLTGGGNPCEEMASVNDEDLSATSPSFFYTNLFLSEYNRTVDAHAYMLS
jgi:hypothetical protein